MPTTRRLIDSSAEPIKEVLSGKSFTYRVPVYQRNYAWKNEQVETLWDDITRALNEGNQEYFLGTVVISYTDDDKKREIVDGQQRLATISMIFSAIGQEWHRRNDGRRADGVDRDYLGSEDRRTGEIVPHLTLNEVNDATFQRIVINREPFSVVERKLLNESNKLIDGAFDRICSLLQGWLEKYDDGEGSALLDLEEFIADKTKLIVIAAGDESDAFIIFETLNDRGLELAVADLVKNYIFSQADKQIDRFKKSWSDSILFVSEQNMSQFLRYYWLSENQFVREKDLYKEIRRRVKSHIAARNFLDEVRVSADLYAALLNPEHDYWVDFPAETRRYLETLALFNVALFRPLALAVMKRWRPGDVSTVLKMLITVSFRFNVITSSRPSIAEELYSRVAIAVTSGTIKHPRDLAAELKVLYIEDETFKASFETKVFPASRAGIVRYILAEVNTHLDGNHEKQVDPKYITLEHILPKNPSSEWLPTIPEDVDSYINRIGNLTLLEKTINRGIGNQMFSIKKEKAFCKSSLVINQDICDKEVWTLTEIEERSRKLAELATQIWHL